MSSQFLEFQSKKQTRNRCLNLIKNKLKNELGDKFRDRDVVVFLQLLIQKTSSASEREFYYDLKQSFELRLEILKRAKEGAKIALEFEKKGIKNNSDLVHIEYPHLIHHSKTMTTK